jgi:hypothetical protein
MFFADSGADTKRKRQTWPKLHTGSLATPFFAKNFQGFQTLNELRASEGKWHAKTDHWHIICKLCSLPDCPEWSAAVELLVIVSVIAIWCFENWS